jgi:hypothetical protein
MALPLLSLRKKNAKHATPRLEVVPVAITNKLVLN